MPAASSASSMTSSAVVAADAVVDDVAEDQRVEGAEHRVDGDEEEEQREHPLVTERELEHALDDPGGERLRDDALVATPCRPAHPHVAAAHHRPRLRDRRVDPVEEREQGGSLRHVEGGEHFVGRVATGGLDARDRASRLRGERHEHRAPVVGIGQPHDEARRLQRLHGGGGRARHDPEAGGELRHPQGSAGGGDRAQEPGLRVRETERREPPGAVAAELRRDAGEPFGELAAEIGSPVRSEWSAGIGY